MYLIFRLKFAPQIELELDYLPNGVLDLSWLEEEAVILSDIFQMMVNIFQIQLWIVFIPVI
jgi:hypothetical protein